MINILHLGLVAYEPAFRQDGDTLQPALWCAVGGYVCSATAKERPQFGLTHPIRVLTRDGRPWRPGVDVDAELGRKFNHLAGAKNLIAAARFNRAETVFVSKDALDGLKRQQIKTSSVSPSKGTLRLFVAAKEFKVLSKPEAGLDRRTGHWAQQGAHWDGQKGYYAHERQVRDLGEGWNPGQNPNRISL